MDEDAGGYLVPGYVAEAIAAEAAGDFERAQRIMAEHALHKLSRWQRCRSWLADLVVRLALRIYHA